MHYLPSLELKYILIKSNRLDSNDIELLASLLNTTPSVESIDISDNQVSSLPTAQVSSLSLLHKSHLCHA